jgi:hypothetical protein
MRRETREVDAERGIIQTTTEDQRWYSRRVSIDGPGVRPWEFVPSVTWISSYYPKNDRFVKWVGRVGNEQAEEAKEAGGEKGSKAHQAIKTILNGGTVDIQTSEFEGRDGEMSTLNASEIECVMSFIEWFEKYRPEVIAFEFTVWSERYRYAGTVDLYCLIGGVPWIVDFKISGQIYPSMEIQVSAYKFADARFPKNTRLAILQLNYKHNKKQKYKFTQVKAQFTLFLSVRRTWQKETDGMKPYQKDFPLTLSLAPELLPKKEAA